MSREQIANILEVARSATVVEGLKPPDVVVILVDKLAPKENVLSEGLSVDETRNIIFVEKSTIDNLVYRILAGVFYLALWETFMIRSPQRACELARKYFFKALIRVAGGSR